MTYTSQTTRFSSYLNGTNGKTPEVGKNGNWWIGDTDTGVTARAVDGVSFSGVDEYYYATLATDSNPPAWDKDTWKRSIQDTGFGTKNGSEVTYNKLWNVELIKSTDANGTLIEDCSEVELFLTHNDSRIPAEYISYYYASTTSSPPTGGPTLGSNNNSITAPTNTNWKISSSFTGSADESAFLFEISFVKYTEKDENGENLYALISGPTMIGHNGTNGLPGDDAVTYVLSVIPNSWNKTVNPSVIPSFTVTKYVGNTASTITTGYTIKKSGSSSPWTGGAITDTTTFDLYIDDITNKVDSETVTAVSNGEKGASSYSISLSEDFISVPCDSEGNIIEASNPFGSDGLEIQPTLYYGDKIDSDWDFKGEKDFIISITSVDLSCIQDGELKTVKVQGFNEGAERGTITFIYGTNEGGQIKEEKARATFEAIKHRQGTSGTPGAPAEYIYALSNYQELKIGSFPESITISLYSKTGADSPKKYIKQVFYQYSWDSNTWVQGQSASNTNEFSIQLTSVPESASQLQVEIYADDKYTNALDKLTITVLSNGEPGTPGLSQWVIFHDSHTGTITDPTPSLPTISYKDIPDNKNTDIAGSNGWYKVQSTASVWRSSKIGIEDTTGGWGPPIRESGVLTTREDLLNVLEQSPNKDGIYVVEGSIAINASAIRTGTIRVADSIQVDGQPQDRVWFEATVTEKDENGYYSQPTLTMAGWNVNYDSITKGNFGVNGSIHLSSFGIQNIGQKFGNLNTSDYWMLGIGSNFGITQTGAIYATAANISGKITANSGKIGGWTIKDDSLVKYGKDDNDNDKTALDTELASDQAFIQPSGTQGEYIIAGHKRDGWSIGIGSKFGITTAGQLYATDVNISGHIEANSGKIGDLEIVDGKVIMGSVQINENLIKLSGERNNFSDANSDSVYSKVYYVNGSLKGKTVYTFSMQAYKMSSNWISVVVEGAQSVTTGELNWQELGTIELNNYAVQQNVVPHLTFTTPQLADLIVHQIRLKIKFYNQASGTNVKVHHYNWIKLEEGSVATAWVAAPSDIGDVSTAATTATQTANSAKQTADSAYTLASGAMPAQTTGNNYNWIFNKSTGITFSNGTETVFGLGQYEINGKTVYGLWLKGHIMAESGQVGPLQIKQNYIGISTSSTEANRPGFVTTYLNGTKIQTDLLQSRRIDFTSEEDSSIMPTQMIHEELQGPQRIWFDGLYEGNSNYIVNIGKHGFTLSKRTKTWIDMGINSYYQYDYDTIATKSWTEFFQ